MTSNTSSRGETILANNVDLTRFFEAAPSPYLLLHVDTPRFTIAGVNDAYLHATGTERAAIVARGLFEVFPDNPHDGGATGVSDLRSSLDRVLRDRAPDGMGIQKYDIPLRDGSGRFEVKYWSPVNSPVYRADGEIDFIIHRAEDVTEFILQRELVTAEMARKIESATAKAEFMAAEVLRSGAQVKQSNRELKKALELLAEANNRLTHVDRLKSEQLDVAIHAARLGLWAIDLKTSTLTTSEACRQDYGWVSSEPFTYEDLLSLIHPADRAMRDRKVAFAFAEREDLDIEYRVIRPDGETIWMLVRGRADYDADGKPVTAQGVSLDITQRKIAEEKQNTLIAELNHRVKNTLASVQSIALQTSIAVQNPREFYTAFDGRVRALVRAHDLLTANAWLGASLHDVVSRTLAPLAPRDSSAERFVFSGPPVRFDSQAAVTLHMGLHELGTNATKYGALSTPDGMVSVTWRIDRASEPHVVEIIWRETGGPAAVVPSRRGFGSNMLENGLARELGGSVKLDFAPEGLVCVMRFAVSDKLGPP